VFVVPLTVAMNLLLTIYRHRGGLRADADVHTSACIQGDKNYEARKKTLVRLKGANRHLLMACSAPEG